MLQTLAATTGPSVAATDQHVAASLLAEVPATKLIETFAEVGATGPLRLQSFASSDPSNAEVVVSRPDGERLDLTVSTNTAGQIDSLSRKAAPALPTTVSSPAGLQQAAAQLGVRASVLVATAGRGDVCTPRQQLGDQGPHPLGSMFKLYVLGAVVRAIQAGKLRWDTSLTVTQAVKSLPSGQLQNAPVGSRVTVQQAATLMISISDNTAADLLIGVVGQPALLATVTAMGNTHPRLLDPFLTTKQTFTLDYDTPQQRQRWSAADPGEVSSAGAVTEPSAATVATRTALLRGLPTGTPTVSATNPRPGWLDGIEWYASPIDICRAQTALHELARTSAGRPVTAIMAKNPGVAVGAGWSYVAYKGGSDTGVLTGSWYLDPSSGAATIFLIQLSAANPAAVPDDEWFAVAASGVIRHLPR